MFCIHFFAALTHKRALAHGICARARIVIDGGRLPRRRRHTQIACAGASHPHKCVMLPPRTRISKRARAVWYGKHTFHPKDVLRGADIKRMYYIGLRVDWWETTWLE